MPGLAVPAGCGRAPSGHRRTPAVPPPHTQPLVVAHGQISGPGARGEQRPRGVGALLDHDGRDGQGGRDVPLMRHAGHPVGTPLPWLAEHARRWERMERRIALRQPSRWGAALGCSRPLRLLA